MRTLTTSKNMISNIFPDDVIDKREVEEDKCVEKTILLSKEMNMMSSARVNYKIKSTDVAKAVVERQVKGMESLKTMLKFKCVSLLIHPTVICYLKTKWSGYGQLVYGIQFLFFFFFTRYFSFFFHLGYITNSSQYIHYFYGYI